MVYRGKPSAACGECRKRRSRCDKAVPACGQCTKAGRICPGYRNTMDLMFHDESTEIVQKNKSQVSLNVKASNVWNCGSGISKQTDMRTVTGPPVKLTDFIMYQPLDELGVKFFMSNYVGQDPAVSQLYYLPTFYAQTGYTSPGLQQSITAAGLAGYAKISRRKDMVGMATKSYISAVRGINIALSDPKTAAQASTLISIIMAAMFEVLIIPNISGMQNCARHLEGAVSVAFLHLEYGRQTNLTRKLMTTLVQSVIINSWFQNIPLPPKFVELKKRAGEDIGAFSVHGAFLDILMDMVTFRHALQNGTYDSPQAIIRRAQEIDVAFDEFAKNMPRNARFNSFRIYSSDIDQLAYEGYYHVYPQRFTAHLWNNIRSSRLRLHQVIIRQCYLLTSTTSSELSEFARAQRSASEVQIHAMAVEIAATVPQLAGYVDQLGSYQISTKMPLRGRPTPSPMPRPKEPDVAESIGATNRTRHDFPKHDNATPSPTPSSSSSAGDKLKFNSSETSISQSASLYHILFQLHALRSIPHLPTSTKQWFTGRIAWMESNANQQDLTRLQDIMRKRPGDGFPLDEDEGYVMQTYDFLTKCLLRPAPVLMSYD